MPKQNNSLTILLAEDDADDRMLAIRALEQTELPNDIRSVWDGEELMDYLHHRNQYAEPQASPRPALILLDLNMPRKDGREALQEIKADPSLRTIPVVVLTTSSADMDIERSYTSGVNAYITKPVTYAGLKDVIHALNEFWFQVVTLPKS